MPRFLVSILFCVVMATPTIAQDLVGSYVAYIGRDDLYSSKGVRLTEPWQILRQDRANYHRFRIRQRGDESDSFFNSMENRGIMERMIMNGSIDSSAARILLEGGATVFVRIYGSGSRGTSVHVTVVR